MYKHILTGSCALLLSACSSAPTPKPIHGENIMVNPEPVERPSELSQEVAMLSLVNAQLNITNSKLDAIMSVTPPPPVPRQEQYDRFVIHYAFNDTTTTLKEIEPILVAAESACRIEINGRTDGYEPTEIEKRVAHARANNIRNELVKYGFEPTMIFTSYLPSGDYAGRNWTDEGRAKNRRAEIDVFTECVDQ
ncbi:outer membrane protein [Vibrio ichthyoenteri ATCC 700023]|uniref:Outer membrane protein n=1 Tax=Vibrio ichthyoenteri ATCC 700023 TaxID=870968 RepID=F9S7S6_9VIBR|nr:OmpA family protein [Vibrio ichthyoenteri]EGU30976.1 outer membrane protein [Vibrio ichthyoenteri ATCC 700023]